MKQSGDKDKKKCGCKPCVVCGEDMGPSYGVVVEGVKTVRGKQGWAHEFCAQDPDWLEKKLNDRTI